MEHILITSFEPFNNETTNSSLEVLRLIDRDYLIKEILPLSFIDAKNIMEELIVKYKPRFIINLGQYNGDMLRIEKFAHNYQRSLTPDNSGFIIKKGNVYDNKDICLETIIDVETLCEYGFNQGIKSEISLSCGSFVDNTVYYTSLLNNRRKALFINVPQEINEKNNLDKIAFEIATFVDFLHSRILKRW